MSTEKLEADRKVQLKAVLSFVLILAILGGIIVGVILMVMNRRVAEVEEKERLVPAVEVITVVESGHQVTIATQGVVESARVTLLAAEVRGRVVEISPNLKRGSLVKAGERLVLLDPSDFRAALANAEVGLADAEVALEQERARVDQARLDWDKLGRGEPSNPLVLRGPQLGAAQARAASARAEVERARRDVERTEIIAPFDAGVRSANVEVGAVVSMGTAVAELFASEQLELRLPLSLEDFGFLDRDANGMPRGAVSLFGKIGATRHEWTAVPVRLDPEIERRTLSGHLVVRIEKREGAEFPLPPVGLFVQATVRGRLLPAVVEIPRRALMKGDEVLVVNADKRIDFRKLEVIRKTEDSAIVQSGLKAGERVCLTRLAAAVVGMEVTIDGEDTGQ